MSVSHIERGAIRAESQALGRAARKGILRQAHRDCFDDAVGARVDDGDGVGVGIGDIEARERRVEEHRGRVAADGNKGGGLFGMIDVHGGNGSGGPAGNENFLRLAGARLRPGHNAVGIDEVPGMAIGQIHAHQAAIGAKAPDDAKRVAKIIGEKERIAVGAEGDSQRIDRLLIVIVARRRCLGGEAADGKEGRGDFAIRAIRRR